MASAATMQPSAQSSHPFTCNTCQVAFRASELQRSHMQTDWHRYNLKRRVASLPPLSSEIFAEKVLANKASAAATAARAQFEKPCLVCQKTYYSENAYTNHLGSQKHRVNLLSKQRSARAGLEDDATSVMSSTFSLGEPLETASTGAAEREVDAAISEVVEGMGSTTLADGASAADDKPAHPLSRVTTNTEGTASVSAPATEDDAPGKILDCLFCNFRSPTFDLNLGHMHKFHGMFIPEREYLEDIDGLMMYLWQKIHEGFQCLYCDKMVYTASGIQTHMRDKGHCKIAYSTEEEMLEIGQFYNFLGTYSDDDGSDDGSTEGEYEIEGEGALEDEGWETDSTVSDVPTDEITSVPIQDRSHRYAQLSKHRHHSHGDPRPHKNVDGFRSRAHATPHAVYHDEYELHLPTGRTAGHRSLNRYYRQNLRNYPTAAERAERLALEEAKTLRENSNSNSDVDSDDSEDEAGGVELNPGNSDRRVARGRGGDRERDRQMAVSRANGGTGMLGVSEMKKREVAATEKRAKKQEQRARRNQEWAVNKKANSQKHFRDPLLQ
ncbi:hypothetical protein K490DRAFT_61569 [Saccharata proteae CBS 121410]|uniref:C2H2-type domain-containing protein n=1 Tax=Saccharata proteae CBS 121410 TaxID=1314787 RepID=A0A9P4M3R5_9PEZI|nr:hypothetical protein K490DRAFT_61569 [Saccharata proteae CBS 121410]